MPGALSFFIAPGNHENLKGFYLPTKYKYGEKYKSGEAFYETYSFDMTFIHPFKFSGTMKTANWNIFENVVMYYGEQLKRSCMFERKIKR